MSRIACLISITFLVIVLGTPSTQAASSPTLAATPSSTPSARATQSASSTGAAAAAAASPSPSENQLKTMVVTATRIRQPVGEIGTTVSVIDSEQIDSQKIEHVGTALEQVPGVQITQDGSPGTETDVSIRGSTSAETLIMIDGVPANSGSSGGFDISNLTTDNIDQIEVLRGAGGSLYGSEAIGGVVNILSQEGEGAPHFSLLSEGGNRATQRQVLTASGSENQLDFSGALSYFSTQGFRPVNDSSDNLAGNLRLDYHLTDDTIIRGFARYYRANVSLADFSVSNFPPIADNPTAHQRSEFMLFNGVIEHHFGEHLVATGNVFFVRNEIRINEVPFADFAGSEVDRIPDETRGGELNAVYTWAKGFRTLAGFSFQRPVVSRLWFRHIPTFDGPFDLGLQRAPSGIRRLPRAGGLALRRPSAGDRRFPRRWQQPVRQRGQPVVVGCDSDQENLDHVARQLQRGLSRSRVRRTLLSRLRQSGFEAGNLERVRRRLHHQLRRVGFDHHHLFFAAGA